MNKINKFLDFLRDNNPDKILNELQNVLNNTETCNVFLGSGVSGSVQQIKLGKSMKIKINDKNVNIQISSKIFLNLDGSYVDCYINANGIKLFVSNNSLVCEFFIWSYANKIYRTPLILDIIDYNTCNPEYVIDHIIFERPGLKYNINYPPHVNYKLDSKLETKSYIISIEQLISYICLSSTDQVLLPNDETGLSFEIIDYIIFSVIYTIISLYNKNIIVYDLNLDDIGYYPLTKTSYFNNENLENKEFMIFNHDNKSYKFKTFKFFPKIMNFSTSMAKPFDDLVISSMINNNEAQYIPIIENVITNILIKFTTISNDVLIKTETYKNILSKHPYNKIYNDILNKNFEKDLMSSDQIISSYNKYLDVNSDRNNNIFIII